MIFHTLIVVTFSPAEWQTNVQSQEPEFLLPSDYVVAIGDVFWVVLLSSVGVVVVIVVIVAIVVMVVAVVTMISPSRTLAFALTRIATAGAMASTRHVLK